jgi:hypothetical protein
MKSASIPEAVRQPRRGAVEEVVGEKQAPIESLVEG